MFTPFRTPQGWCTDPFGRHEARWFSGGDPTALVRDGGIESTDPPPAGRLPRTPKPVTAGEGDLLGVHTGAGGGADVDAVWSIFVSAGAD
jgi:hypothetical protein